MGGNLLQSALEALVEHLNPFFDLPFLIHALHYTTGTPSDTATVLWLRYELKNIRIPTPLRLLIADPS
ncbi:MAG TPA: hypothetical protein VH280_21280 [Verrucomicrobiae bacterium]|jgi:hypothetical protein|nr:hypothetical protein [Verrucomicrobiae bacterium]